MFLYALPRVLGSHPPSSKTRPYLRIRLSDRSLVTNRRPTNACALSSPVVLLKTVDLLIPMSVKLDFAPINQMGRLQCGVNGVWEAQVDLGMRPLCGGSGRQCETPNPNKLQSN